MLSVDMNQALYSEGYAKKCYINYYYKGNTMGITPDQIGEIAGTWDSKVTSWQDYKDIEDENEYEIDDTFFDDSVERGRKNAESDSGYKNTAAQQAGQVTRTVTDGAVSVAGNTVGKKAIEASLKESGKDVVKMGTKKSTKQGAKQGAKQGLKLFIPIACALDAAEAAAYRLSKPNETQMEAVRTYAENMGDQMALSAQTQDDLITMDEELICNTDEANTINEDANMAMAETKTDYDFHKDALEYLQKAKVSGHEFTQEEKDLWEECVVYMNKANEDVTAQQAEAQSQLAEINKDMESYQDGFDDSVNNIGEVEGYAAEAGSVDESTQTQTMISAVEQGLNGGSAALDAYTAFTEGSAAAATVYGLGLAAVYYASAAVAGIAAASDADAAVEQGKWSAEAGNEITAREATQLTNADTLESYNEKIDDYAGYLADVGDLEIVIPDDISAVEDTEAPEEYSFSNNSNNNSQNNPQKNRNKQNNPGIT